MKIIWTVIIILAVVAAYTMIWKPDIIVGGIASAQKCYGSCTDPNRPYYDLWGNEFSWQGVLIHRAKCSVDPITKKRNPYCVAGKARAKYVRPANNFRGK